MKPKKSEKSQGNLFYPLIEDFINKKHPLVKLSKSIDWKNLEDSLDVVFSNKGRAAKPTRLMIGLHYLKYAYGLSDEQVVLSFLENPYYQYFCGEKVFQHDFPIDSSSLTRWRKRLNEEKLEQLLGQCTNTALRSRSP